MSEGPVLTVGFGCVSPQTGDGLLTLTFADEGGRDVQIRISKSDASRLAEMLSAAVNAGQPVPRRRYHDIKPGRFQN